MPRPASVTKPALSLAAVSLALFGIAKTTGSGWLIVLLAAVGAVALLAVMLPLPAVLRVRLDLATGRDGCVGSPLRVRVTASGTRAPVLVRIGLGGEWTAVAPPTEGWLTITPERRGVYDAMAVEVRAGAPLGLVWWKRPQVCYLERPLEVGPWPADVAVPPPAGSGPRGHEARSAPHHGDDLVRGAREYRAGDPIKTVHWPSSARHGQLMVKEREAAAAPPVTVVADLRPGGDEAEVVAALAAGVAVAALDAGIPVLLATAEPRGPIFEPVASRVEVLRRLARAVPGAPPAVDGGGWRVVRVDARGIHW